MDEIEKFISDKNYDRAIKECFRSENPHMGILLSHIKDYNSKNFSIEPEFKPVNNNICKVNTTQPYNEPEEKTFTRIKLLCNWTTSKKLREEWNKMSQGNYTWNNLKIVLDNDPDYFVVINAPPSSENPDPKKTIVFQMEPYMSCKNKLAWGKWSNPNPNYFFKVCTHKNEYNNNTWHLSKTYNDLKIMTPTKTESVLSTVLSQKYNDEGHIKRIDFIKFMEKKNLPVHVFGSNKWNYNNYKGSLPPEEKDKAMFPYKYVFNCENNSIKNYYTEKLIDGILAECLVFYSGCYNVRDYIDERAFVYLELKNFEEDYNKVKEAINNNLWEERIEIIRKEKFRILNHLQFFPRIEKIINKN